MVVSAGASGAVFGLAGVLLATLKWGSLGLPENARTALFKNILQFAGINLVVGLSLPGIDNAGHVGGLLSGLLVGAVMGKHLDDSPDSTTLRRGTWIMLFGALLIGLALSIKWHSHLLSRLR
jgi:rhomboid protease GluP